VWRERAAIDPQNRVLQPHELAQAIAFLCSDAPGGGLRADHQVYSSYRLLLSDPKVLI